VVMPAAGFGVAAQARGSGIPSGSERVERPGAAASRSRAQRSGDDVLCLLAASRCHLQAVLAALSRPGRCYTTQESGSS